MRLAEAAWIYSTTSNRKIYEDYELRREVSRVRMETSRAVSPTASQRIAWAELFKQLAKNH
jgi:hypothetical protein